MEACREQIIFNGKAHERFYTQYLSECRVADVYHKALIYCLGIAEDTRSHIREIYEFQTGLVRTECLRKGWITSGSSRIIRMAFNLYCSSTPSVYDYDDMERQLEECQAYTVEDLFCCTYARYFWQAVRIRFPNYI